jgi:hypothetical protein
MSNLETIEAQVRKLPMEQALELQDWLADYFEDSVELNPEFVASIERGNADLREGPMDPVPDETDGKATPEERKANGH